MKTCYRRKMKFSFPFIPQRDFQAQSSISYWHESMCCVRHTAVWLPSQRLGPRPWVVFGRAWWAPGMAQGEVLGTCCAAPFLWGHGACQLRREAAPGRAKGWLLGVSLAGAMEAQEWEQGGDSTRLWGLAWLGAAACEGRAAILSHPEAWLSPRAGRGGSKSGTGKPLRNLLGVFSWRWSPTRASRLWTAVLGKVHGGQGQEAGLCPSLLQNVSFP